MVFGFIPGGRPINHSDMSQQKSDPAKSREVASRLEDQILRSGMRQGWRLPSEEQLCRTHSVSRTVVREAIQQVKARGLVTSRRGGGTYVAPAEVDGLQRAAHAYTALVESAVAFDELVELRAVLEATAARELTRRKDREAVARIKTKLDTLRKLRDQEEGFVEALIEVRLRPAEEVGNTVNLALLRAIHQGTTAFTHLVYVTREHRDRALAGLDPLYEAMRTGNAEAAGALAAAFAATEKPWLTEARLSRRG